MSNHQFAKVTASFSASFLGIANWSVARCGGDLQLWHKQIESCGIVGERIKAAAGEFWCFFLKLG